MNLSKLIRKKFLPPINDRVMGNYQPCAAHIDRFIIKEYFNKFYACLIANDREYLQNKSGEFRKGNLIEHAPYYESIEEAREICWDRFDQHLTNVVYSKT